MLLTWSFTLLPVGPLQKLEEEKGKKEKERLELERDRRERDKERERERERRDREKEKERERERDKERERERDREREKTKERERERSRDIREDRSRSKSVGRVDLLGDFLLIRVSNRDLCRERAREDKKRDRDEDEEDVYERRRLERRLRDKEAAYQEVCPSSASRCTRVEPLPGRSRPSSPSSLFLNLEAAQKLGDPGEEEVPRLQQRCRAGG